MAFIKTGDAESIDAFFDDKKIMTCDRCGKALNTICLTDEQNEPICTCEDKDDADE